MMLIMGVTSTDVLGHCEEEKAPTSTEQALNNYHQTTEQSQNWPNADQQLTIADQLHLNNWHAQACYAWWNSFNRHTVCKSSLSANQKQDHLIKNWASGWTSIDLPSMVKYHINSSNRHMPSNYAQQPIRSQISWRSTVIGHNPFW